MSEFLQDLRYAARLLIKQPGFTTVTIAVLALGIGATTAIFSVVDAVLLRPLPYADADRLVSVQNYWRTTGTRANNISAPDYYDWRDRATSFDGLAAYTWSQSSVTVSGAGDYVTVARVTAEFFPVLGARASLGRLLDDDELRDGGPASAVVSDAFWRSHLGGDRDAIGRTIKYRERVYTVVGVLTPEVGFPTPTDVWVSWWTAPVTTSRSAHNYRAVGKLKRDVTLARAQAEMDGLAAALERQYPQSNENKGVAVDRLQDQLVRNVRTTLNLIFGVVVVVLLIACANVSNLLLARATSRTREVALRAAIGATRGRVLRQMLTESALLAIVAGTLGVIVGAWGIRGLLAIAPQGLPRLDEVGVNWRMLAFAFGASVAASVVFGMAPALQTSRVDLNDVLKQGGRGSGAGQGRRLRSALIVFETAAAVVLVIAASLLIRSFAALSAADMGFRTDHLLLANTTVPAADLDAAKRATRFYRELLAQLAVVPGVRSAAATTSVPTQVRSNGGYFLEGGPTFEQLRTRSPQALFTVITPDYFRTIGVTVRGRDFGDADADGAPLTAIVNEALARAAFPGQDPIGRRIMTGLDLVLGPDGTRYMTIVGVAADVRATDPSLVPQPQVYMPYQQHVGPATAMTVLLRTAGDPQQLANVTIQRVRELNVDVPVKISTMDETVGVAVATPRFRTILLALFAALALVLAMAGVYGIVSFVVSQRTSEIGLRMALGARRSAIVRSTLASGVRLTAIGVAIGWAAALALTQVLASMLFDVRARDPIAFGVAPALLLAVACLASLAPALRASRVDPSVTLRVE
jgi:putative ABC transport system permease protein